jgi:hypothetical protein
MQTDSAVSQLAHQEDKWQAREGIAQVGAMCITRRSYIKRWSSIKRDLYEAKYACTVCQTLSWVLPTSYSM